MPLETTHIRFALDLQNKYEIKDMSKYISGTIYPDSRYVSKIDRSLTHNDEIMLPEFGVDDFHKGWQVHQICDKAHNKIRKRLFPDIFPIDYKIYNEQGWIDTTALKIIQDMDDMQSFNIQFYMKDLEYHHNPYNENIINIKNYNQIMIDLYKNKKVTSIEDNIKMWLALGQEERLCREVEKKCKIFLKKPKIIERVKSVYSNMITFYETEIKK